MQMIPTLRDRIVWAITAFVLGGIWIVGTLWRWWMVFFPLFVSFVGGFVQMVKGGKRID